MSVRVFDGILEGHLRFYEPFGALTDIAQGYQKKCWYNEPNVSFCLQFTPFDDVLGSL